MTPPPIERILQQEEITVKINNIDYKVPSTFSEISLNDYLRTHLHLTGTKVMCREGGCGACIVHVAYPDPGKPASGQIVQHSVNSCLCPILSCDNWEILTVEGLGDKKNPHPVQSRLAKYYGTQCGYCSPGMVMSMYSLLQTMPTSELTKQQVEDWFAGNICRCTGYRPILEAFRSFAPGNNESSCNLEDVEDLGKILCKSTGKLCSGKCSHADALRFVRELPKAVSDNAPPWFKPATLSELYQLTDQYRGMNPYYVVGHTGVGVYNDAPYRVYIDLKGIPVLFEITTSTSKISVGANVSLADLINLFTRQSATASFSYLKGIAELLSKTANPAVRNAGSWAGNVALKNLHKEMPSDSFIAFAASDARVYIGQNGQPELSYGMAEFLNLDMKGKIILRVELTAKTDTTKCRTFKVMPRSQNSHSYVHAAFILDLNSSVKNKFIVKGQPALAFGNISSTFVRATQTEMFLANKDLGDVLILQQALKLLNDEIIPEKSQTEATPEIKKCLAVSFFYKFALEIVGDAADLRYQSAVGSLHRPISSGQQNYQTKKENWPLTQPMPKLEALIQCSGEAKYISDIDEDRMVHAAFALTNRGNATIYRIDTTAAMAVPGVVRILMASDIPGENDMTTSIFGPKAEEVEPLLATNTARYAGEPVAIVVAVSKDIAEAAAKLVQIQYSNVQTAVSSAEQAMKVQLFYQKMDDVIQGDATAAVASAPMTVSGDLSLGTQAHFHMETQTAVAYPTESGLVLEAGSQWLDATQNVVAKVNNITKNTIRVNNKRNGGGFGAKIERNNSISAACSLAALILKKPVKMHMHLWDNLKMIGKRWSWYVKYKAGFDSTGKLAGICLELYSNIGGYAGHGILQYVVEFMDNVYHCPAWKLTRYACKTHIPANTPMRAPGSTESIFIMENIFEHIASVLGKPAVDIKRLNFLHNGDMLLNGATLKDFTMSPIFDQLLQSSEYDTRVKLMHDYNEANRWRKRGMAVVPMMYPAGTQGTRYNVYIAIFTNGGTVSISHGGIEVGQGINTKVAQVVAYEMGIDMKYINIESTNSFLNANGGITGSSLTSELCCLAAMDACDQLKTRMDPVRAKAQGITWEDLVNKCFDEGIDLSAHGWVCRTPTAAHDYHTFGAMCTEVEVDTLTGEYQINRLDVLYDCGESMSPLIDVGQVEGAIVMGLGYYTCEKTVYDDQTAENLTHSTWTYKLPSSKEIPVDFRITLLPNAPNPSGVLRSKLVAEPPLCMTCSVVFALRNAIVASRVESGKGTEWFRLDAPLTPARVLEYCAADITYLRYK